MAKKPVFHFYLRDKKNPALIIMKISYYGETKVLSTTESINPDFWDKETERAFIMESGGWQTTNDKKELRAVNKRLEKIQAFFEREVETLPYSNSETTRKYNAEILSIRLKNGIKTLNAKAIVEERLASRTPTQFFKECVEKKSKHYIKRTNTYIRPESVGNHERVLNRFIDFLNCYEIKDSWEIFEKKFKFEDLFREYHLKRKKYAPSTFCQSNSLMKTWLAEAEDEGLLKDPTFHSWQTKAESKKHIYLTEEELDAIASLSFDKKTKAEWKIDEKSKIEETRDLFIIGANTGLRSSDLNRLNDATWNIQERHLSIYQHKTGGEVKIPLRRVVIDIYNKYNGHLPTCINKSHFNRQISKCAQMAGINEMINIKEFTEGEASYKKKPKYQMVTSHTARRSFATNLYKRCGNALLVMKLTGHKTESVFMDYICITPQEVSQRLEDYMID